MRILKREKPILTSFACGCSLYTGTMVFTVMDMINALLSATMAIMTAVPLAVKDVATYDETGLVNGFFGLNIFLSSYYFVVVILSSLAIHGARTTNGKLLVPWLLSVPFRWLVCVVTSIVILAKASDFAEALAAADIRLELQDADVVVRFSSGPSTSDRIEIITLGMGLWSEAMVMVYAFLVVISFYIELKRQQQRQGPWGT